jgi:hypothetical protein
MSGISSVKNDRYIVNQFKRNRNTTIKQLANVSELNEDQVRNLCGNYLRMGMFKNDNNDKARHDQAMNYENATAKWLIGVEYYTEKQLQKSNARRQQRGLNARPTPDFLFKKPTVVDGVTACWVECKNYYATTENKVSKKLGFLKTAVKYRDAFGPGIMVFRFGFNKDIDVPSGVTFKHLK